MPAALKSTKLPLKFWRDWWSHTEKYYIKILLLTFLPDAAVHVVFHTMLLHVEYVFIKWMCDDFVFKHVQICKSLMKEGVFPPFPHDCSSSVNMQSVYLRRGAFSSMSSRVSSDERWEMSLRLGGHIEGKLHVTGYEEISTSHQHFTSSTVSFKRNYLLNNSFHWVNVIFLVCTQKGWMFNTQV